MSNPKTIQSASVPGLALTGDEKLALINQVCSDLGIGGWCCPEAGQNFDTTLEEVETEWKRYVESEVGREMTIYTVALLIATGWERECVLEDWAK